VSQVVRARSSQIARGFAHAAAGAGHPLRATGRNRCARPAFASVVELVESHFRQHSDLEHVNFASLHETLRLLDERSSTILETGASAWGTDSSLLFDEYVTRFGGEFETVDIRLGPLLRLRPLLGPRSAVTCDDSVRFLRNWVRRHPGARADLVYLDSFDVDFASPFPAAQHGLAEFWAIRPALRDGSLLLVDDTPATLEDLSARGREAAKGFVAEHGLVPGKGMFVDLCLRDAPGVTKLHHGYQALYRFD
jgi:hypothetical protein